MKQQLLQGSIVRHGDKGIVQLLYVLLCIIRKTQQQYNLSTVFIRPQDRMLQNPDSDFTFQ